MAARKRRGWELPEAAVTDEAVYRDRRRVLSALGLGAGALLVGGSALWGCRPPPSSAALPLDSQGADAPSGDTAASPRDAGRADAGSRMDVSGSDGPADWVEAHAGLYPAPRNSRYAVSERALSPEPNVYRYNNYYELTTDKGQVHAVAAGFRSRPWSVDVGGLVAKPRRWDFDALLRAMTLEERVYRHRCVETWAMTVPWTGFPLSALVDLVQPLSKARYIAFTTLEDHAQMPGIAALSTMPWPYTEGLRLDEAKNELTLVATGVYGKPLPAQLGTPLRLVVPWQYGFKSIKSIVRIDFVEDQPKTFWNTAAPQYYGFNANVDPTAITPWSQSHETLLGTGELVKTLPFNGYASFVAGLYK